MARPLKRTVDYFPHFVNAGKTLLILQNEFGNDGYAFWFKLLSLLCKTDGLLYDYNNPAAWRLLLAETSVSEDIANKVLQLLSDIGAIDPELYLTKIIWVQNLIDNLGDVFTRRRNGATPERPVIANINPVNVNKKPQTRLDKTRQDQTKKKYGEFNNVLLTDKEYQKLKERFTDYTEKIESLSAGLESKGYKYGSHYATILNWERRDREQEKQSGTHRQNSSKLIPRDKYTKPPDDPGIRELLAEDRPT